LLLAVAAVVPAAGAAVVQVDLEQHQMFLFQLTLL
jgi:hypothetical protein